MRELWIVPDIVWNHHCYNSSAYDCWQLHQNHLVWTHPLKTNKDHLKCPAASKEAFGLILVTYTSLT